MVDDSWLIMVVSMLHFVFHGNGIWSLKDLEIYGSYYCYQEGEGEDEGSEGRREQRIGQGGLRMSILGKDTFVVSERHPNHCPHPRSYPNPHHLYLHN